MNVYFSYTGQSGTKISGTKMSAVQEKSVIVPGHATQDAGRVVYLSLSKFSNCLPIPYLITDVEFFLSVRLNSEVTIKNDTYKKVSHVALMVYPSRILKC